MARAGDHEGEYLPIAEHGMVGDLHTIALVGTDGTIDWYCCPAFDAPSVFGAILDKDKGGFYALRPTGEWESKQLYFPDTNVLITRFFTPGGVGEVQDFMPIEDQPDMQHRHRLLRRVVVVRGAVDFELKVQPRFDYAREEHEVELHPHGVLFRAPSLSLALEGAIAKTMHGPERTLERRGAGIAARFTVHAGEAQTFVLERVAEDHIARAYSERETLVAFEATVAFWRRWLDRSRYRGRWREMVHRSALTLKLLTYKPTGALVAAPTTSLPEQIGGERNWDYRYTWIRDASFSIHALLGLGFFDEAQAFLRWLRGRIDEASQKDTTMQVMYRVDGAADLHEEVLDHLEGYKGSRPVRIGNGAADQLQLDIYGEAIESIYFADRQNLEMGYDGWRHLTEAVDRLCEMWDQPDDGIWETRGGRRNFVYSRVQSWVAFDRAIRLANNRGRPADVRRWADNRDAVYRQVMDRGWSPREEAFVQYYGSDVLDAALLIMPMTDFVSPSDPLWQSTLHAIDRHLVSDSLVYRYDPEASPDGLRGSEGTFSMCTFWYVDALARSGRLDEARLVFDKMLTYSNHAGLFAEEIGPRGEQLGNFPQAFSHVGLINAAVNLDTHMS
jgi:pentatricopeptide repeat protein